MLVVNVKIATDLLASAAQQFSSMTIDTCSSLHYVQSKPFLLNDHACG